MTLFSVPTFPSRVGRRQVACRLYSATHEVSAGDQPSAAAPTLPTQRGSPTSFRSASLLVGGPRPRPERGPRGRVPRLDLTHTRSQHIASHGSRAGIRDRQRAPCACAATTTVMIPCMRRGRARCRSAWRVAALAPCVACAAARRRTAGCRDGVRHAQLQQLLGEEAARGVGRGLGWRRGRRLERLRAGAHGKPLGKPLRDAQPIGRSPRARAAAPRGASAHSHTVEGIAASRGARRWPACWPLSSLLGNTSRDSLAA